MSALEKRMVLHRFMCEQFGYDDLRGMLNHLNDLPDNQTEGDASLFARALDVHIPQNTNKVTKDNLADYDRNITACSRALGMTGDKGKTWKPFQYLALLFTERYLDMYFQNSEALLTELNRSIESEGFGMDRYAPDDLRTLAFQSATGSGKTLLLHANILQYLHYLKQHRQLHTLNKVILLTPDEGLSRQHLAELTTSHIPARIFSDSERYGLLSSGDFVVDIIDLHKLAEKKGVKRVALESFEDNNLILVDEGHLGVGGTAWRENRKRLALNGFTFEYSATFNQAVAGSGQGIKQLRDEYGKSILFDYSYKFFYEDGYGKDYQISNLPQSDDQETNNLYLLACLLTFYQQCQIYTDKGEQWRDFNIAHPLWVFLGKTVTGGKKLTPDAASDMGRIINFLAWVLAKASQVEQNIARLISENPRLIDQNGKDIFSASFSYIKKLKQTPRTIYDNLRSIVFRGKGKLRVSHLTGTDELQLSAGDAEPFGAINVGDASGLYTKLDAIADKQFKLAKDAFRKPLFAEVDNDNSPITIVIGARKFVAGWNSWRVSTMGLMNVGQREGPQIIQMFGRGVRLKGHNMSLKRHTKIDVAKPSDSHLLRLLETLYIFGLKANYMDKFRDYLQKEDIPDQVTFEIPVEKQLKKAKGLKIIQTKRNAKDFEYSDKRPDLPAKPSDKDAVVIDLHRHLQVLTPDGDETSTTSSAPPVSDQFAQRLKLISKQTVYHKVLERKQQSNWHNLAISQDAVNTLLDDAAWYDLYAPPEKLAPSDYGKVSEWENIAADLVCEYAKQHWQRERNIWEHDHMQVVPLKKDHPNYIREHKFTVAAIAKDGAITQLVEKIKQSATKDEYFVPIGTGNEQLSFLNPDFHAYIPLVHASAPGQISVSPAPLNDGERKFIDTLKDTVGLEDFPPGKKVYLMRNLSKGKGISFFADHNFYPDFILWITDKNRQDIVFIDPKGLEIYNRKTQRKVELHKNIKDTEKKLSKQNPSLRLHAYIWSHTPSDKIGSDKVYSRDVWHKRGVFFARGNEVGEMLELIKDALGRK